MAWCRGSLSRALVVLASLILLNSAALAADTDSDGIDDLVDNCLAISNPSQADCDQGGSGDACEVVPSTDLTWGTLKSSYR